MLPPPPTLVAFSVAFARRTVANYGPCLPRALTLAPPGPRWDRIEETDSREQTDCDFKDTLAATVAWKETETRRWAVVGTNLP